MPRRLSLLIPILFPLVLTFLPWVVIRFSHQRMADLKSQRDVQSWQLEAQNLVHQFRAVNSVERKANRGLQLLHRTLEESASFGTPTGTTLLEPSTLVSLIGKHVSRPIRPLAIYWATTGTTGTTGPVTLCAEPGFSTENRALMTQIIKGLLAGRELPEPERRKIDGFIHGRFGPDLNLDVLTHERQGRLVQAWMGGRPRFIAWNRVKARGTTIGAYFLIFPNFRNLASAPLRETLSELRRTSRKGELTILVSHQDAPPGTRPILPQDLSRNDRARLRSLVQKVRSNPRWEDEFPLGKVKTFGSFHLLRDFAGYSLPYEVWVVRRAPGSRGESSAGALVYAWALLLGWGTIGARILIFGTPLPIKMGVWFRTLLLFLAGLPLTALYVAGSFQIQASVFRLEQETLEEGIRTLKDMDVGSENILLRYQEDCRDLIASPPWAASIRSSTESSWTRAWEQGSHLFSQKGITMEAFMVQARAGATKIFWHKDARKERGLGFEAFMADWFLRGSTFLGPEDQVAWEPGSTSGLLSGQVEKDMFMVFLRMRGRFWGSEFSGWRIFQFIDCIQDATGPANWIVWQADLSSAFAGYLRRQVQAQEIAQEQNLYSLSRVDAGSQKLLYPREGGKSWFRMRGPFTQLLDLAGQTDSLRVVPIRDGAMIAHPCHQARPYLLGSVVSFHPIHHQAASQLLILRTITLLLIIPLLLIGWFVTGHLFQPLAQIEQGLLRVAGGNLDEPVLLDRRDELGTLTASFEELRKVFQQRRALGRFVSGSLDSTLLSNADQESVFKPLTSEEAVILCSDLRGFTTLAEAHPPQAIVQLLNDHLELMSIAIGEEKGLIEQFIGDAIIAVFPGKPLANGLHAAVAAARRMMAAHRDLVERRLARGEFAYGMGVGISAGLVDMGTIRSPNRLDHALIGPIREEAEVLESLSREGKRSRIVLSPQAAACLPEEEFLDIGDGKGRELASLEVGRCA